MRTEPKTEKEIAELGNLPKGIYPFEVLNATAKMSKAGNEMIELELLVHAPSGRSVKMRDWLMAKMARKLYNFCANCGAGLKAKYDADSLTAEDCLGVNGYLFLSIQKGRPRDDGNGDWPDRNAVADYCSEAEARESAEEAGQFVPPAPLPKPPSAAVPVKARDAAPASNDDEPF